ncbi:MAG TPA: hypothetical protein DCK95_03370 [Anaerolineaceae bacterium]|nr:hypothetical protein [Anaerolineaceae bacterium]
MLNGFNLNIDSQLVLRFLGVFSIIIGIVGMSGLWKRWYFRSQRNTVYGYPLLGVTCILGSFEKEVQAALGGREWLVVVIYAILLGGALLISYSPPQVLKPRFVKRIEQEPHWVYEKMVKEVMSDKPWGQNAKNRTALEKWIKEIKKKGK